MRVDNGAVGSTATDLYTRPAAQAETGSQAAAKTAGAPSDRSSLSNASELVGLAKTLMPADKLKHFEAINAALNAGQYEADPASVSQALIDQHLNG